MGERRSNGDTAIGGKRCRFPSTDRSAVLGVGSDDPVVRARAFTQIVRAYWKPAYKHVRLRFRKSNEEAKDLTQAFFARAFEKDVFSSYDPGIAKFRTYVKRCLDNFVANAEEARGAKKRGGGTLSLSLDFGEAEEELAQAGKVAEADLDALFDREWARAVLRVSADALREELVARGREKAFEVFRRYDLAAESAEKPTYGALASELDIKTSDVSNYLNAARKRFREIALAKLEELTASEEEFEQEARELLGVTPDGTVRS